MTTTELLRAKESRMMSQTNLLLIGLILCGSSISVAAEEVRPGVFRTPDERFENLKDYPFAPHYLEVDSKVGKLRMHYVDVGPRDADPILLMHGEPSWSYLYRNMIPRLVAAGHRVIAPDLIGFGKSDKPAKRSDHSYQNHVDWIRQFVSELELKNITLFCQDWGSLIGLRIVAGAPDRFARVVAGNAALPAGPGDDGIVIGGQWTQPDPKAELRFEEGFMGWLKYSQTVPEFDCGIVLQAATVRKLTEAELDGYRAPFPDERYAAGPRVIPTLVRMTPLPEPAPKLTLNEPLLLPRNLSSGALLPRNSRSPFTLVSRVSPS